MITNIITELKNEQAAGNQLAMEFAERLNAHIRDFENLKAWVFNNLAARSEAIDLMLGEKHGTEIETPAGDGPVGEAGDAVYGPDGWATSGTALSVAGGDRHP